MIIANCPKCGAMNATTTCTNCGWSQFTKSTVSTRITGETELKVSGKALLDDYKRLLFENRNLKERVAELESAQRWVPVSEPPTVYRDEYSEFIPFLVCTPESRLPFRAVYDGDEWGDGLDIIHVTHWMPLPESPNDTQTQTIVYGKEDSEVQE
jgi:hypothetical protein